MKARELILTSKEVDEMYEMGIKQGKKEALEWIKDFEICDPVDHSVKGYWIPLDDIKRYKQVDC